MKTRFIPEMKEAKLVKADKQLDEVFAKSIAEIEAKIWLDKRVKLAKKFSDK